MDNQQDKKRSNKLKEFLFKNKDGISNQVRKLVNENEVKTQKIKAVIISEDDQQDLKMASQRLKEGKLVSFPTQTVYGLGANALDKQALLRIYRTKRRPLSDPIIVHIQKTCDTFKYVEISQKQKEYFNILTKNFWPGPLTVILKANLNILPSIVTAQTGFVGIRCPQHPYIRKLLKQSQLPIGAPSANLFSHVSPTEPVHVFNDFYQDDVMIVDGDRCKFGIESTVLKIFDNEIQIFREGSLSVENIQNVLQDVLKDKAPKVNIVKKTTNQKQNTQAPGQMLKHYSPNLPCYYIEKVQQLIQMSELDLKKVCFISFDEKTYGGLKNKCNFYFEVGNNISLNEQHSLTYDDEKFCSEKDKRIMRQIYYLLRKAQNLPVTSILIGWMGEKSGTVWDKIFRATEGKKFKNNQD